MKKILLIIIVGFIGLASSVEADENDMRIVSLLPSNTEILYELDLLDQVVGVTTVDFYPEELEDMDIMRFDAMNLDVEVLIELEPTHILTHEINMSTSEDILERASDTIDVEVLVLEDSEDMEDIAESIQDIGEFLDVKDEADDLAESFLDVIDSLADEDSLSNEVLVFVSLEPEIYTVGRETFIDNALKVIGLVNSFEDIEGYPTVSKEDILVRNPEYAINITGMDEEDFASAIEDLNISDVLINDVDNQCNIDPDTLARPTVRIVEGLEALRACIDD